MVVVGPEVPLVEGIHDYFLADPRLQKFRSSGLRQAAQLEGSKDFAKAFMNAIASPLRLTQLLPRGEQERRIKYPGRNKSSIRAESRWPCGRQRGRDHCSSLEEAQDELTWNDAG